MKSSPNLMTWSKQGVHINSEFALMFKTQYGIPLEILEDWFDRFIPVGSSKRAFHITKAYDKAHGTNYSNLFELVEKIKS